MAYLVTCPACRAPRRIDAPGFVETYCTRIDCERSWAADLAGFIVSCLPRHAMSLSAQYILRWYGVLVEGVVSA